MNYLEINYPGLKLTRRSEFSKLNKEYIFPFLDEEETLEGIIKSQKDKTKIIDTNHEEILSI